MTSKRQHVPLVGATTTILTTNIYDHVGRLLETKKKVNEQPEVIQSRLSYNEIGQLKSKDQHSENGGTDFLNTIDYTYNERGWTKRISSPQFTQQLKYHEPATGKQYNGNIAQQLWGHGVATASTFTYSYDRPKGSFFIETPKYSPPIRTFKKRFLQILVISIHALTSISI
ncbi:hypothetical protein ACP6L2_14920 [Sphingobacterium lactis]|uniref:hypothetical protein n=1 Tax=Sphingobacterium lactis TaxID=797291 RepID=UPI003F7F8391